MSAANERDLDGSVPASWLFLHNVITVIPSGNHFMQEGRIPRRGSEEHKERLCSRLDSLWILISALLLQISSGVISSLDLLPEAPRVEHQRTAVYRRLEDE